MSTPPAEALPVRFHFRQGFLAAHAGVKNAPKLKSTIRSRSPTRSTRPSRSSSPRRKSRTSRKSRPTPRHRSPSRNRSRSRPDKTDKKKPPEHKPDQIADLLKKDTPRSRRSRRTSRRRKSPHRTLPNSMPIRSRQLLDKRDPQRANRGRRRDQRHGRPRRRRPARRARNCRRARSMRCARVSRAAGARRRASTRKSKLYIVLRVQFSRTRRCRANRPWSKARPQRSGRRSPRAPSARCCCASRLRCSSPNITTNGKISNSNSIRTNCLADEHAKLRTS